MKDVFRSVDSLETEGDAREDYAEWMASMANTAIVEPSLNGNGITFAGIPVNNEGVFDVLPF
ncbi:MAG: hypothetical protein ABGX43_00485 [Nitrospinaceae bacterium]|jgi:hypothetical protein